MNDSPLLYLWLCITDELASLQETTPKENQGHITNPISGSVYTRDTAYAANIFATEYLRTGDKQWQMRAEAALQALHLLDPYKGVDEPIWNRHGWHNKRGSMASTAMLLDSLWKAEELLGLQTDENVKFLSVADYVRSCYLGNGLFAHDTVNAGHHPAAVQNTTAMALYLLEAIAAKTKTTQAGDVKLRSDIYSALKQGQRSDGFWPYVHPGAKQQLYYRSRTIRRLGQYVPLIKTSFLNQGDLSIFFGDTVHHILVLYYLAKSVALSGSNSGYRDVLRNGWEWTARHLVEAKDYGLRIDFSWEPKPSSPRYGNFCETSAYFVIVGILPVLADLGIIGQEYRDVSDRLLLYVAKHLVEEKGVFPSIKAYEGPAEILRNILPRVGESVAWKGGCLADVILRAVQSRPRLSRAD